MLKSKVILIIGGYGMVGHAVCRELMAQHPSTLIVTSLLETEAKEAVDILAREFPDTDTKFVPLWGNIFVRAVLKDTPRGEVLANPDYRKLIYNDVLDSFSAQVVDDSYLGQLITGNTPEYPGLAPDIIIDAVNTATALAYQDIYHSAADVRDLYEKVEIAWQENERAIVERLLISLYTPQLVRHVQILNHAMRQAGTQAYLKIGTSGTGGMGLNIPYTHGEEKPSRVLLSKAAMAGAHTSLLFLMARTPDGPAVKEIKPTAAITWKNIAYGPVKKRGQAIILHDCPPEKGVKLNAGSQFNLNEQPVSPTDGEVLQSVFIDTGENGLFSLNEYTAITSLGQMEAVTPEDIAKNIIAELRGLNTGKDIIAALDGAVLGPSYRAGLLRHRAIAYAKHLAAEHQVSSVAFEILGPPKMSKLLFEGYILKSLYRTMDAVANVDIEQLMADVLILVTENSQLRQETVSIGIPILMPDGETLLAVNRGRGEHRWERNAWNVSPESINLWAETEWIDLRESNMVRWQNRMQTIIEEINSVPSPLDDSSSQYGRLMNDPATWEPNADINVGEVAAWIFNVEEEGTRMKE